MPGTLGTLLLLGALLFSWPAPIPSAIVLLAAGYAASLFLGHPQLDVSAPLVAGGLVLVAELAYLALELRPAVAAERGLLLRRSVVIGALALGSTAAGGAVLGAGALPAGGNLAWEAIGVAAAVGVVAVLTRLAREHAAD